MVQRPESSPPICALSFLDESGGNDIKFLMSKVRNKLSHEVTYFKILSVVNTDLEDLVFGTMKRNIHVTKNNH